MIELLRHGETTGSIGFRGRLDDPLSARGWEQMWAAIENAGPWTRLISSPLRRCAEFAQALSERQGLPLQFDPRWREMDFGQWEGRTAAQLLVETPTALTAFWADPIHNTPPEGEPLIQLQARVFAAWAAVQRDAAGEAVLVISHAGPMRVLLCQSQQLPLEKLLEFELPYASRVTVT